MDSLVDKCTNANTHKHGPFSHWPHGSQKPPCAQKTPGPVRLQHKRVFNRLHSPYFLIFFRNAEIFIPFSYTLLLPLTFSFPTEAKRRKVALGVKNPPASEGEARDVGSIPGLGRSLGGGHGNPLQFLPEDSHGERSLVGYSLQGHRVRHNWSDLACKRKDKPRPVSLPGTHGDHH